MSWATCCSVAASRARAHCCASPTSTSKPTKPAARARRPRPLKRPDRSRVVGATQGVIEIVVEIARFLDADRQAKQVGWTGRAGAFDARAMLDQALNAAQRSRALPQLDPRRRGDRRALTAFDAHRQHAAEAPRHLPACHVV